MPARLQCGAGPTIPEEAAMPDLIAKRAYRYGGRALQPGDAFEASPRYARILKAIRKAEDAPLIPIGDDEGAEEGAAPAGRGRGRYQRRDLRAED